MRVGVISDTHIPGRARTLPLALFEVFEGVDLILHAGDFVSPQVLDDLGAIAPVKAVFGNMDTADLRRSLPETEVVDLNGVSAGMVHDAGPTKGRRERLRKMFPQSRVAVFGHSHQPLIEDDGSLLMINPGSACDPRRARIPTVALLNTSGSGMNPEAELVQL